MRIRKKKMAITINTSFLRTVPGLLKIVEFVLVLVVLLIARFGVDDEKVYWGNRDYEFLGIGASVGFAIIVPAIILTYLLGAHPNILEFIINLVGGVLFISMGATIIENGRLTKIVGGLAISLGIVFLIDFIYLCITTKFTVYHTTNSSRTVHHTTRTIRA